MDKWPLARSLLGVALEGTPFKRSGAAAPPAACPRPPDSRRPCGLLATAFGRRPATTRRCGRQSRGDGLARSLLRSTRRAADEREEFGDR
jgi:hypothetical protein